MNKYGLPLAAPSTQSILPVMYASGRLIGFFSIPSTVFTGAETTFALSDTTVPIKSVTIDVDPTRPNRTRQYMAAVYSDGTPNKLAPWASSALRLADEGYTRLYRMPTQTWATLYQPARLQVALETGMSRSAGTAPTTPAPTVTTPATLYWKTSISYQALLGDCMFFDFNWVTLFAASSSSLALRIVSTGVPAATPPFGPPFAAQVLGIPTAVGAGAMRYDTIRIMRLLDTPPVAGAYTFNFNVYAEDGQVVPAVLTLTVQ